MRKLELRERLKNPPFSLLPCDCYHTAVTTSTNQDLKDLLPKRDTALYADYQTSGRGQGDHVWHCGEREGLLMSLFHYPKFSAKDLLHYVAVVVSTSLDYYGIQTRIKIPNDILVEGKKIAGILLENSFIGEYFQHSIIGIGINLRQTSFSDATYSLPPVSLLQLGVSTRAEELFYQILFRFYDEHKADPDAWKHLYQKKIISQ